MTRRTTLFILLLLVGVALGAWVTDFVTMQGEWTIYTVTCQGGAWRDAVCSGTLVPSKRYRFRALHAHGEVLFWTVGEKVRSGKFIDCTVEDGRDWSCEPTEDAARTITHRMVLGRPVPDPRVPTIPFHRVQKWKWEALRLGVPVGKSAMD